MAEERPKGYLAKYGSQLIDNGYRILPISRGTKRPPLELGDWRKVKSTQALLRTWIEGPYSRAGVGIDTRDAPAADLDILDVEAVEHMRAWIEREISSDAPIRVGLAPKLLFAFRTDEPFAKLSSKKWVDDWCDVLGNDGLIKPYQVEILGHGQQYVAAAVHPDTKEPYKWIANGNPVRRRLDELPTITQAQAQAICDEFDRYAESRGWEIKQHSGTIRRLNGLGGSTKAAEGDIFANDKPKVDISEDELHRKLLLVPGSGDYDTWVQIGMALWHQYDGEDRGLELWHEWSETAHNYDSAALDEKWDTFNAADKSQEPLTARIIIKLADQAAAEIAVETFREVKEKIAKIGTVEEFGTVCEEIKHIEFNITQRMQLVGMVQKTWKRLTDSTMPVGTARDLTRFENPKVSETPKWLEGWVYVSLDNTFYSLSKRYSLSVEAFNAVHNRFMLTKKDVLEGKAIPEAQASAYALNSQQIDVVHNRMYLPGEDDIFTYNGLRYVNSYDPASVPEPVEKPSRREREAIERVERHFSVLFDDEDGAAVVLDAITWIVQNPGKRLNWAILIQGTESDGKTFFAGLLAAVLGPQNVKNMGPDAFEDKFNGWAEGRQVVFFEEIRLKGHNRHDVLNKVKPLITNTMISIRRMNVDHYEALNTSNYFLTTNFRDALPLTADDTRYYVIFGRHQSLESLQEFRDANPSYYADLYETLEHAGALRSWLLNRKISPDFEPYGRAPASRAKREMVSYADTEESDMLTEVTSPGTLDCCSSLVNVTTLTDRMGENGGVVPYGRAMAKILLDAGFSKLGKVRTGDQVHTYWSKKPSLFRQRDGAIDPAKIRAWISLDDL
jgi:hypothetical protein